MGSFDGIEKITKIKLVCMRIYEKKAFEDVKELRQLVLDSSSTIVKTVETIIFSVFFPILKAVSENTNRESEKQLVVDTFKVIFDKVKVDKLPLFFNIYSFLLFEIYDPKHNRVQISLSEEYKLSVVECVTSLAKSLDDTVIEALYVKENVMKLSQMIYVLVEMAKHEQFKALKICSINCIMSLARVLDDDDFSDVVTRDKVADVFLFFLPGVASQLATLALIDEKFGHKIPAVSLKAWGRLITLLMQDYNPSAEKEQEVQVTDLNKEKSPWKDPEKVDEYINTTGRSDAWYKLTDKKLERFIIEFEKLTHHSHYKVRVEILEATELLLNNCYKTMPTSLSRLIDIVIILSEDTDSVVSKKSQEIINKLSGRLSQDEFKTVLDNIQESFHKVVASIPRKFNQVDERVQVTALNSLIGYIQLFGQYNLSRVLHSMVHLNHLVSTLIHISEFDRSHISLTLEYTRSDFELDTRRPWLKFRHFKDDIMIEKIGTVCRLLAKFGGASIISDLLLDTIASNSEQRKEAIFLLNEFVVDLHLNHLTILKNIIETYTDNTNWYLPTSVMIDDEGYEHTLGDVQSHIIQMCLLVEGLGKIAGCLKENYQNFMLRTLYLVLERAGSAHPALRIAGYKALHDIATGCGYSSVTSLIIKNLDYFSFHITRNLRKGGEGGLQILAVVIRYGTHEVLNSTCEVVKELLLDSCDTRKQKNLNAYFYIFKMFLSSVQKILNLEPFNREVKTKKQKLENYEDFHVSEITAPDLDEGKTAEEMFEEDMKKTKEELQEQYDDVPEYTKPELPPHIKLTTEILKRSLHYLPSKEESRKLLILDILLNGVPILKEWEDELLPVVHQIWGPLVDRFKEENELLTIHYSFKLLLILAQVSKDFIRMRTSKDVFPSLLKLLEKLSIESYLKDKGSAYRYSQKYKFQLEVLDTLEVVVTELDMGEDDCKKCLEVVGKYLSDKQPLPLQEAGVKLFSTLIKYDPEGNTEKIKKILSKSSSTEFEKNAAKVQELFEKSN